MRAVTFIKIASIVFAGLAFGAGAGWTFEEKPFDTTAFGAAQSSGKPLLIDVYAPWCPVCKAQQTVLSGLKQDAKYDDLTVLKVDFDHQPDVLKSFNVRKQSTLIAFKGKTETGRSTGDTNKASIEALIKTAMP
ncbi:MAG TPA: thioredoxin family protein [Hyphomicrobium sp.]|jgi:thioredoxin-like negative regulator of GroEL